MEGLARVVDAQQGYIYEGQFMSGEKCGYGRLIHKDGYCYDGMFQRSQFEGDGKIVYANGTAFEGVWNNNKLSFI